MTGIWSVEPIDLHGLACVTWVGSEPHKRCTNTLRRINKYRTENNRTLQKIKDRHLSDVCASSHAAACPLSSLSQVVGYSSKYGGTSGIEPITTTRTHVRHIDYIAVDMNPPTPLKSPPTPHPGVRLYRGYT